MDGIVYYLSNVYFYLIYLIIVYIFITIVKNRKRFPKNSSIMLIILASLLAFFGTYLFIRSLGSGYRYGSGTCGPDGCIFTQPLIFTIDEILFQLLFPITLFTAIAALYLLIRKDSDKTIFDGAGIIFAGSFLDIFSMLNGAVAIGIIGIIVTSFLIMKAQSYRNIYYAIIVMFLYAILFW